MLFRLVQEGALTGVLIGVKAAGRADFRRGGTSESKRREEKEFN
jgi:hypothetical protein